MIRHYLNVGGNGIMSEKQRNTELLREQVLLKQEVNLLKNELRIAHENYDKITRDLVDSVRSELEYRDAIKRLHIRIEELKK